jgi:hypothetical protein
VFFFHLVRTVAARKGRVIITEQGWFGQSPRQKSLKIVTSSRLEWIKVCRLMRHENAIDTNLKSVDLEIGIPI